MNQFEELCDIADELEQANSLRIEYNKMLQKLGKSTYAMALDHYWQERKETAKHEITVRKKISEMLYDKYWENRRRGLPVEDLFNAYADEQAKIEALQFSYRSAVALTKGKRFSSYVRG